VSRVVVTGMAGISPLGNAATDVMARLRSGGNAVQHLSSWDEYEGLNTRLAAPAAAFTLPGHYTRKSTRSMGRVAVMAVRSAELALEDAGLAGSSLLGSGDTGISYGSSSGSPDSVADFAQMILNRSTSGITANTYLKMMGHTAPVNIDVFFGIRGRVITTSSACTSGSQGIGYAYEAVRQGKQVAMIAGGAEELSPTQAAVFDTLFATSTRNDTPDLSPRPFDRDRDGLVIGEGSGTLILENLEHAMARGARIHAEIVGFGTNSDGGHVTHPAARTMRVAMELALADAGLEPDDIGYVNAHGTATRQGDSAESSATQALFGPEIAISSLKGYMGHTLGACGALEAWMSILMMQRDWYAPNVNLDNVAPDCAELDYLRGPGRSMRCRYVMSNNFAFGGINTSLIFRRWHE
jgi:3-oxoacyl-[acyl-carrier-protein] synthase II